MRQWYSWADGASVLLRLQSASLVSCSAISKAVERVCLLGGACQSVLSGLEGFCLLRGWGTQAARGLADAASLLQKTLDVQRS